MKFVNRMGAFCGAATLVVTLAGISNSVSAADLELVEEDAEEEAPKQADEEAPTQADDSPSGEKPALPDKRFRGTLTHHDRKKT